MIAISTPPFFFCVPAHRSPRSRPRIRKTSPRCRRSFVAIYGEATAAEARGLKQVAGCGYRKAVEFLIKDFCVKENPADAEAIKTQRLGTVIQERISDPNIKAMAARATWIGNDETHYVRIWTDKDMTDLKALMSLTVSWINTHLLTRKYVKEMPEGGAG